MQPNVLEKLHYGHRGSDKCKLRAKTCIFWSGINNDIDRMMQKCAICQELQKSQTAETLMPHEIPARPWQIIATDISVLMESTTSSLWITTPTTLSSADWENSPVKKSLVSSSKSLRSKEFRKDWSVTTAHILALSTSENLLEHGILSISHLLPDTPNRTAWQNDINRPSKQPWRKL